jgi:hypothetical protein
VAFAVAHSMTLTLAAFELAPMGTWFEPTIGAVMALSLVYVAVENGVGRGISHRWIVAFVFGLFHGLGFAMALQESLQFAGSHSIIALMSFNVGLELGTLIILAIAVPALNLLLTGVVPERAGIIVSSVLIGHVGWHWMAERFTIAQMSGWPLLDLQLLLTVVRWLLALTVVGGALWFLAGFMKRKPEVPEVPEKSIVDSLKS